MMKLFVSSGNVITEIEAEEVFTDTSGILRFYYKNHVVAEFKTWDFWIDQKLSNKTKKKNEAQSA